MAGYCQPSKFSAFSAFSASIPFLLARLLHLIWFIQYAFHAFARRVVTSVVSIMVVAAVCVGSVASDTRGADLNGHPMDFEMGDAIYRDLVILGVSVWHAGIYYKYAGGTASDPKNHLVLHQGGKQGEGWVIWPIVPNYNPATGTLHDFIHGYNNEKPNFKYRGNYTSLWLMGKDQVYYSDAIKVKYLNNEMRNKIITTANAIINQHIPPSPIVDYSSPVDYIVLDTIAFNGTGRGVNDIVKIRCDGFVEYCYEANGIMVWGELNKDTGKGWKYSILSYPKEHNYIMWGDQFSPINQATSVNNTRMRPATGTPPAIQRPTFYPINNMKSIHQNDRIGEYTTYYANTRTFTIITPVTDSESGVKKDSYQFWIQEIGDTFLKKYGDIPNPRSSDTLPQAWSTVMNSSGSSMVPVTVPYDGVYIFWISAYDNAGNESTYPFRSRCIQIDTQPPATPTISS
ncbi:MAG: hypothetical protein AAB267_09145, partial [Candidatus Desantisbacteria bacterium]